MIRYTDENLPNFLDFFKNHMIANQPCLLPSKLTENWRCVKKWRKESNKHKFYEPDFEHLLENFGILP